MAQHVLNFFGYSDRIIDNVRSCYLEMIKSTWLGVQSVCGSLLEEHRGP